MSTDAAIITGVRALWDQGHLRDFTIHVEDCNFKVHKLIMASVSDYFRAMLTGSMAESTKDVVTVGVITALAMENLISFIYKDHMELTEGNVAEILDGAMYLQIPTAVKVCVDYMITNVNPKDCYPILSILQGYSLTDGVTEVRSFIASNVKNILNDCDGDVIPYEEFTFLMGNWPGSEIDLFPYVNKWVDADHGNREQYLNDLLCKVRLCLMSPEELKYIQSTEVYKTCPGSWHELVDDAVEYHRLPLHARVLHDSVQSTLRSGPRLLCLYDDNADHFAAALDENNEWTSLDLSPPAYCYFCKAAISVNNFLFVCPREANWHIFDPRTLSWFELPPTIIRNDDLNYASVYHEGYLYVLGGSQRQVVYDSIERYNFQTNEWGFFTDLPNRRHMHAACVFKDCIYMSGGRHDRSGGRLDKVDCLNIDTLTWESKAPMLGKAAEHFMCVMKLHGKNVILVVHEDFHFEYYNGSTDQWTSFFATHNKFPRKTYLCGLITKGSTVYFLDDQRDGAWTNEGQCLKITFPEEGTHVSVTSFEHFVSDMDELEYNFYTHGAVLSLPDYKLPGLTDRKS